MFQKEKARCDNFFAVIILRTFFVQAMLLIAIAIVTLSLGLSQKLNACEARPMLTSIVIGTAQPKLCSKCWFSCGAIGNFGMKGPL